MRSYSGGTTSNSAAKPLGPVRLTTHSRLTACPLVEMTSRNTVCAGGDGSTLTDTLCRPTSVTSPFSMRLSHSTATGQFNLNRGSSRLSSMTHLEVLSFGELQSIHFRAFLNLNPAIC